jgi:hypothetical protein
LPAFTRRIGRAAASRAERIADADLGYSSKVNREGRPPSPQSHSTLRDNGDQSKQQYETILGLGNLYRGTVVEHALCNH